MKKTKDWIKKSKKRCKYAAIAIILFAFCVPIGYSSFGEAETSNTTDSTPSSTPTTSTTPAATSETAKGFKSGGDAVVHAKDTNNIDASDLIRNIRNTLSGTRIDIEVDQPFQQGNRGFANGESCVFATVEVIAPQGVFLKDEPLVIEKPDAITIDGPTTSDGGSFRWCITSTEPIQANIKVKLANFPQNQTTFRVDFQPTFTINDRTNTSGFFFDQPITFISQIDPWMVQGLKEAKVVVNTERCGAKICEPISVEQGLNCSFSGICSATIPECVTKNPFATNQTINYSFQFEDTNGNKFQQTNSGSLRIP